MIGIALSWFFFSFLSTVTNIYLTQSLIFFVSLLLTDVCLVHKRYRAILAWIYVNNTKWIVCVFYWIVSVAGFLNTPKPAKKSKQINNKHLGETEKGEKQKRATFLSLMFSIAALRFAFIDNFSIVIGLLSMENRTRLLVCVCYVIGLYMARHTTHSYIA